MCNKNNRFHILALIISFVIFFVSQNCFALNQQSALTNKSIQQHQPKLKRIAISFDDGPNGNYTKQILTILKQNNAKATFFVCGYTTDAEPNIVKEEFDEGHEVGNHSYSHPNLAKLNETRITQELSKTNDAIYTAIQQYPTVFRPPFGSSSSTVKQVATKLGLRKVTWDFMANYHKTKDVTPELIASSVIAHAHSGSIIVLHDGFGDREQMVAALPAILKTLKGQGYEFVTVAEILNIDPYQTQRHAIQHTGT